MGSSSFSYVQSKKLSIQLSLLSLLLRNENLQCNRVGPRRKHLRSRDDLSQQTASCNPGPWSVVLGPWAVIQNWAVAGWR